MFEIRPSDMLSLDNYKYMTHGNLLSTMDRPT